VELSEMILAAKGGASAREPRGGDHVLAALHLQGVSRLFTTSSERGAGLLPVDLRLTPGEIVVVVGASGCGKSTLLRIAAGLERTEQGRIRLAGEDATAREPGADRGLLLFAFFGKLTDQGLELIACRVQPWQTT